MKILIAFIAAVFCLTSGAFGNGLPVIAVLDFEPKKVDSDTSELVSELLGIEFVKSGKFQVVERTKMKSIIEEQKLQLAGLTGSDFAEKLGKMLAADKLVIGTVTKIGDTIHITAKVVDSESGVIEKAESVEVVSENALSDGVKKLAGSLTGSQGSQVKPADPGDNPFEFIQNTIGGAVKINIPDLVKTEIEKGISNSQKTQSVQDNPPNTNAPGYFTFDFALFSRYGLNNLSLPSYGVTGTPLDLGVRVEFNVSPFFGFGLGGGTTLLLNNSQTAYELSLWDFGFTATFNLGLFKFVRLQVSALAGFGGYTLTTSNPDTNFIAPNKLAVSTGMFAVLEPVATLTFNITSFFDRGLIYSFKWTSKTDGGLNDFSHSSIGLIFVFGTDFN